MGAHFLQDLEAHGPRPALLMDGRILSYGELVGMADAAARKISREPGLIFLEAANTIEAICAYVGCLRAGHAVLLLESGSDSRALVERYGPRAIVRAAEGASLIEPCRRPYARPHRSLSVLLSTSGSTGSPKLVKLSAANLGANALSIAQYLDLTPRDRAITSLKFNYSYGMSVINSHLAVGASLILTEASVADDMFWTQLEDHGGTSLAGVPYSFEILHRSGALANAKGLRYVTQAGGRLAPALVRHFAQLGRARGWAFYVMYGQTEAGPRMGYLPPALAADFPDAIGLPVPGGAFHLIDDRGERIDAPQTPGELVYEGPNVMMGYAHDALDLASDAAMSHLRTGDIARRDEQGLYFIVGRAARFIKPFGLRISLDEAEATARAIAPSAQVAGDDHGLAVAVEAGDGLDARTVATKLAAALNLPANSVVARSYEAMPRLTTGKTDYGAILQAARAPPDPIVRPGQPQNLRLGRVFLRRMLTEVLRILGLGQGWTGVGELYATILERPARADQSFTDLAGDSLSYVQVSLALEDWLGELPQAWETLAIGELEGMRSH